MAPKLTADQAAEILGVTPARVRQLAQSGELKGEKFGVRMWVFTAAAVEKVRARKTTPGPVEGQAREKK